VYSQQKKIPDFFSSSVRRFVKSSTAPRARATPFTTATTSSVLGTPDESRTDYAKIFETLSAEAEKGNGKPIRKFVLYSLNIGAPHEDEQGSV
jgi:hypothetical protein